jgi:phosphatidylserine synthase
MPIGNIDMNTDSPLIKNVIQAIVNIASIIAVEEIFRQWISESMVLIAIAITILLVNLPFEHFHLWRLHQKNMSPLKKWIYAIVSFLSFIIPFTILYDRFDFLRTLVVCYVSHSIISVPCEYWISRHKQPDEAQKV